VIKILLLATLLFTIGVDQNVFVRRVGVVTISGRVRVESVTYTLWRSGRNFRPKNRPRVMSQHSCQTFCTIG